MPGKNIMPLNGKPLIQYTLEAAKGVAKPGDEICVSTDDAEIIQVVEGFGIPVPFVRPGEYATDTASSQQVIEHSLHWYKEKNITFDVVALLQPTSPLRNSQNIKQALELWDSQFDMVASVKSTDANPYYVLREENEEGFLEPSKKGTFKRRQDCPDVWELNGAIYLINPSSVTTKKISEFKKVKKYIMKKYESVDIDDFHDFKFAEYLLTGNINL